MRRIVHDEKTSAPGTWRALIRDQRKIAKVACPMCGLVADTADHRIETDGRVNPSLECPSVHCTFHDYVQLDGWTP